MGQMQLKHSLSFLASSSKVQDPMSLENYQLGLAASVPNGTFLSGQYHRVTSHNNPRNSTSWSQRSLSSVLFEYLPNHFRCLGKADTDYAWKVKFLFLRRKHAPTTSIHWHFPKKSHGTGAKPVRTRYG